MKMCKECGNKIPKTIVIDGKQRNLERRSYCLECNPYGKNLFSGPVRKNGESKSIPYLTDGKRNVNCNECGKQFLTKTRNYTCSTCRSRLNRRKNKIKAVMLKGGKCKQCGYSECLDCLCFHHIDPSKKEFTISMFWLKSWEKIQSEIEKCDLLCTNCHCKLHADLRV